MSSSYAPPLDRLLKLGAEPARRRVWPDYRHLGLLERHVPDLVRMATDPALHTVEERHPSAWAPVHAWRALAQLGAGEAAAPLLALFERVGENGWVFDELPAALGMIGPAALPGATLLLFDEQKDEAVRVAAAQTIANVGHEHPERRGEVVALLAKQLEDHALQDPGFNALLVAELVGLEAKEAAPAMEAAFAAGAVDLRVQGDWEDVQIALGMLEERATPPTAFSPLLDWAADDAPAPPAPRTAGAREQARKRRKAEKQSRKRNRKRK
ncbi:hypothetical protein [Longimicrobium sp.]|uniref:hypothetical protein n=1 Tax=Longimicrobium sp. TaxID=2029185 RepID=UPI002B89BF1F|nr:hypothetical protein [Longimicrobium sp.]HSU13642.1 hypothetical protein [Longimicrobium sp.]